MKRFEIIGLMSGTSMDGIDGTILVSNGKYFERTRINLSLEYDKKTKCILLEAEKNPLQFIQNQSRLDEAKMLVTMDHFKLVKQLTKKYKNNIEIITFHGQTIYLNYEKKLSVQIGDPQLLADLSRINVVANLRENDINHGGHGAPISPIYHQSIIDQMSLDLPACFINIGGVSNLTYWDGKNLIGFDTGPGNGLLDKLIKVRTGKDYDYNGSFASKGTPNTQLLKTFINHKYFNKKPPKSLDKLFFYTFLKSKEIYKLSLEDAASTVSNFTSETISLSMKFLPTPPKIFVLMGGGSKNKYIINQLKSKLDGTVVTAEEVHLPGQYIEAEMMAFLGSRSLNQLPFTFPSTTGVHIPKSGGVLYKPK